MTETPDESTTLPAGSVVDLELVKHRLGLVGDTSEDAELERVCAAVDALVRDLPTAARSAGASEWHVRTALGAEMLAARLHRRRNSPDGVAAFTEAGAVYVRRNDPDVAQLLELGDYARPAVG